MLVHIDEITRAFEQIGLALLQGGPDGYVYGNADSNVRFFLHALDDGRIDVGLALEYVALWDSDVAAQLGKALSDL